MPAKMRWVRKIWAKADSHSCGAASLEKKDGGTWEICNYVRNEGFTREQTICKYCCQKVLAELKIVGLFNFPGHERPWWANTNLSEQIVWFCNQINQWMGFEDVVLILDETYSATRPVFLDASFWEYHPFKDYCQEHMIEFKTTKQNKDRVGVTFHFKEDLM